MQKLMLATHFESEFFLFDDACILDIDNFVKRLSSIKEKGVRPDLIGSIITHYASKWLPDLLDDDGKKTIPNAEESPESVTTSWMKKRFFVETLVGILPPEKESIPCNFLLRLLRIASMVRVEPAYRDELEKRVSWQLDQASLSELMIPSFSHTCTTLLDVELVLRLVRRFMNLDEAVRSGAALIKVTKLVDCYLAEAAVDSNLTSSEFVALASEVPSHARAMEDGLYRAIDTYLKAHPGVSKKERNRLCKLIDSRKLSLEASIHAAQNERLPVRTVVQVLFSEQNKLNKQILDFSGPFSGMLSPNIALDASSRCLSKREINVQQMEIKRLKEDVLRLQSHCMALEGKIDKLMEKKKGFLVWRKFGIPTLRGNRNEDVEREAEVGIGLKTPLQMKTRLVNTKNANKWRKSLS
ncbi:root phototropism protein 3-like [Olea europaea var. sylvestris]|uniref:root phototropism protein 3-like n=1 Tax=Olea europaea var. sylvestris TaxID=158386 RepID=UPI000C1CEE02|nr:root phototropism protein 3-like [Olea europaea var. sylvestris]